MRNRMDEEDIRLKKIRYFQGTIMDFASYIAQKQAETSSDTAEMKKIRKHNKDLNKSFQIIPVEKEK